MRFYRVVAAGVKTTKAKPGSIEHAPSENRARGTHGRGSSSTGWLAIVNTINRLLEVALAIV